MSWTYNPDLQDVISQIRFQIGDTDSNNPLFQDEELQYLYNTRKSVNDAARQSVLQLMHRYAQEMDYQIGPEKVWAEQRYNHYKGLYTLWGKELVQVSMPLGSGINTASRPFIFSVGMHDNPGGD